MSYVVAATVVLTLGTANLVPRVPAGRDSAVGRAGQAASAAQIDLRVLDLAAVRRLLSAFARLQLSEGDRAAALGDVSLLVDAITGETADESFRYEDLFAPDTSSGGPRVRARPGVGARDAAAYQLLALGYSAHETADVVSGRISQRALDVAREMLAAGQSRDIAANYLDGQYKRLVAARRPVYDPPPDLDDESGFVEAPPTRVEALIDTYANLYNVNAGIVRAMIGTESGFNQRARSHAGAIGLMQLMPATARELGVDPRKPEQNIEGGVRYFSELLKMFGTTELALIAYNGGPGFARRYARREVALYGETRNYVKKVMGRMARMTGIARPPRPVESRP